MQIGSEVVLNKLVSNTKTPQPIYAQKLILGQIKIVNLFQELLNIILKLNNGKILIQLDLLVLVLVVLMLIEKMYQEIWIDLYSK